MAESKKFKVDDFVTWEAYYGFGEKRTVLERIERTTKTTAVTEDAYYRIRQDTGLVIGNGCHAELATDEDIARLRT